MTITFHPEPESLMSCSAGSMPEAFAAVMAAHITICPQCQKDLALMQDIGIALFDKLPGTTVTSNAPVMALRAGEAGSEASGVTEFGVKAAGDVPAPLVPIIGPSLDAIEWSRVAPGVWQHPIALKGPAQGPVRGQLRLIKVAPGMALPEHSHNGSELTLIVKGSYRDATGHYTVGDVADMTNDAKHSPVADPVEGCICLAANDGKMKFKSLLAKLIQPFTGF
jgi:putative transcriptional regulator